MDSKKDIKAKKEDGEEEMEMDEGNLANNTMITAL